jgi:hypothetical protein
MNSNTINHKIQKYSHKLQSTRNLEQAQLYQNRLRFYERMYQSGGADGETPEAASVAPVAPAAPAPEAPEVPTALAAPTPAPAAPEAPTPAPAAPEAPVPEVSVLDTTEENEEVPAVPEPVVEKTEEGLSLNLGESLDAFTDTLEQYWNKFHKGALDQMEATASMDLGELEKSLNGLYSAIDGLKGLNDFNSDAAKLALAKISETAIEIKKTAERIKDAQPDIGERDKLIGDVTSHIDTLTGYTGNVDHNITKSEAYGGILEQLQAAEKEAADKQE